MIVLGIDPGSTRIGYGVVEHGRGTLACLAYGTLDNPGTDKLQDFKNTEKNLSALIKKYKPDAACIEKLFFFNNQKTVTAVSEMRGILLLTLAKHNIPVQELTPLQVKQNISAYGRAPKEQMQRMVKMLLNLQEPIKPDDAADALALAICYTDTIIRI